MLTDEQLAQQQRDRRDYLFSDEAYGQRCRDNEQEMAQMWTTFFKWGGLPGLVLVGFFAAVGHGLAGLVVVLFLLSPWILGLIMGTLCASLFPGWRGMV